MSDAVDAAIITVARTDALNRLDRAERIRRRAMQVEIAAFMRYEAPKLVAAGANVEEVTDAAVAATRTALALDVTASESQPAIEGA